MKKLLIIVAALSLSGCVTTRQVTLENEFNEKDAAFINKSGNNSIKGNAFLRQNGGGVVTCAGNNVLLVPATKHAKERLATIYGGSSGGFLPVNFIPTTFTNDSPNYAKMNKLTKCDSSGNFEFNNLANGEYYVISQVTWKVGYNYQGGYLSQLVSIKNGKAEKIIMTM